MAAEPPAVLPNPPCFLQELGQAQGLLLHGSWFPTAITKTHGDSWYLNQPTMQWKPNETLGKQVHGCYMVHGPSVNQIKIFAMILHPLQPVKFCSGFLQIGHLVTSIQVDTSMTPAIWSLVCLELTGQEGHRTFRLVAFAFPWSRNGYSTCGLEVTWHDVPEFFGKSVNGLDRTGNCLMKSSMALTLII